LASVCTPNPPIIHEGFAQRVKLSQRQRLLPSETLDRVNLLELAADVWKALALKHLLLLSLLLLLVSPVTAQESTETPTTVDDVPYIYYYSGALNGIVIERADGTDSRIIGQGLVDDAASIYGVQGAGWSPDGRWFAWSVLRPGVSLYTAAGEGYITSADGETTLSLSDYYPCVFSTKWHPTENILFVFGLPRNDYWCTLYRNLMPPPLDLLPSEPSYSLIDRDSQLPIAMFVQPGDAPDEVPSQVISWLAENEQFFQIANYYGYGDYDDLAVADPIQFQSWDDVTDGMSIEPLPNSNTRGRVVSGQWDESANWILVGYDEVIGNSDAAYVRNVSIFNPVNRRNRELTNCKDSPICVGWLPERVNLAELPPGSAISVLPEPQSIEFTAEYHPAYSTHKLICSQNENPPRWLEVRNRETGQVDFELPNGGACVEIGANGAVRVLSDEEVVFALSPDGRYYALTVGLYFPEGYTSLYDAETGERITTLNFYGIELSFSDDSRTLTTVGRYATATWDIETLIANSLTYPSEGE
jgi:hypothetical protein